MKKLIRLFIAIFCIFFVLQAMPGSFLPAMKSLVDRSAHALSEITLLLAEKIDGISDGHQDQGRQDGSGAEMTTLCRFCTMRTKSAASTRESIVPVSSQA